MVSGYLLSFLFVLLLTSGIFLFGYAARRVSALYVTALEIIFGSVLITPMVLLVDGINFSELFSKPSRENWIWLGVAAITGFIGGNFFSVINLKTAGERNNSLLSPAITACAVAASALVFSEPMNLIKLTGVIITLTAIACFLIYKTKHTAPALQPYTALWSGIATVVCITLTIICSVKGTMHTQLSIMHSVWLRLVLALPFVLIIFLLKPKLIAAGASLKVYSAITGGVISKPLLLLIYGFTALIKLA